MKQFAEGSQTRATEGRQSGSENRPRSRHADLCVGKRQGRREEAVKFSQSMTT